MRKTHRDFPVAFRDIGYPRLGVGGGFSPVSLFAASEPGAWYDPSDLSTLFQDDAGTTPVTAAGQAVGMIRDKSGRGNHATQATPGSRPLYQIVSGKPCLVFDGTDDFLITSVITPGTDKVQVFAGIMKATDALRTTLFQIDQATARRVHMEAPGFNPASDKYVFGAYAGTVVNTVSAAGTAPDSAVLTGTGDLAVPQMALRRNGTQVAITGSNPGASGYPAAALNIGRTAGNTNFFNGNLYGLILRYGPNLDGATITSTEGYIAARTGVTL